VVRKQIVGAECENDMTYVVYDVIAPGVPFE
jgi:hypothetical protein